MARVRVAAAMPHVGLVSCWFSPLLREISLRVLRTYPQPQNQHFQSQTRSGMALKKGTKNHYVDGLPLNRYLVIYLFIYLSIYFYLMFLQAAFELEP